MIEIHEGHGNKAVYISIDRIDENTRRGIRQGFFRLGSSLRRTASRQILSKNKTGRIYRIRRGKTYRRHRASAPGESPANLSGNYRRKIGFQIRGHKEMEFGGRADHSHFLEDGTTRMEPRPGLGNAVKAEERNSVTYFESEISRNLKR